jgi:hypothetical protein
MSRKTLIACAAIGGVVAALSFAGPVKAGTCLPVRAKGEAKKMAAATTLAQINLKQKAINMGGKVTQASTNCVPGPIGFVCKINAVVCTK